MAERLEAARSWWCEYVANSLGMFSVIKNQKRGDFVIINPDEAAKVLTDFVAARDLAIGELVKAAEHVVGSKDFIDSRPLMNDLVKALENFKAVSNG